MTYLIRGREEIKILLRGLRKVENTMIVLRHKVMMKLFFTLSTLIRFLDKVISNIKTKKNIPWRLFLLHR